MTCRTDKALAATGAAHDASPYGADRDGLRIAILRQRGDFLRAARAGRKATQGFVLQARRRGAEDASGNPGDTIRVGFTCSKKVGNAVTRNRAKRRLREVARAILPVRGRPGWDYVLVGRSGTTVSCPFDTLREDLCAALASVHDASDTRPPEPRA